MTARRADWLSIVEAGYRLQDGDADWLRGVLEAARPVLQRGSEPVAWRFDCTPGSFRLGEFSAGASRMLVGTARLAHALASEASLDLSYRAGAVVATASEHIFPRLPDMRRTFMNLLVRSVNDMLVITCHDGVGSGACIGMLLNKASRPTAEERRRWPLAAAHIGAALRLRKACHALPLDAAPVEAVLDGAARVHDARGPAQSAGARDKLREMVRRIERSRTEPGRADADEALRNWEGLVGGRWSLVDRFDTDGRRFVVAVKNDPAHRDPRGLTQRERQVAELAGLGKASKEIAYVLGVTEAAVTNCTARAQVKLGLASRAELVAFFAHDGLRRKLAETAIADEALLVGAYPLIDVRSIAGLSDAERAVTAHLVAGSTNSDIARRRGSSVHTIENQVQSIFRKLGVHSRAELVVRLQAVR